MKNKNIFRLTNIRWWLRPALCGALMLTGCVVAPDGRVEPAVVEVAPEPVVVVPEVVVPVVVVGGGRERR